MMILEEDAKHLQTMLVLGYFLKEDRFKEGAVKWMEERHPVMTLCSSKEKF